MSELKISNLISPSEEIINEIRNGRMVILVDEEDRENEGDLVLAADFVTPEAINFMARYGRGLICLTLTEEKCRQLNLPLMVSNNNSPLGTNFTVSIEAAEGVTTGISAADRARTVQAAVRADALKKFPKAKWVEYEALSRDNELAGSQLAYGQPLYAHPKWDKAKIIVALDHDFLGLDAPSPFFTSAFAKRRRVESEADLEKMSRLYAVEAIQTLTGGNADHRLRVKPSEADRSSFGVTAALTFARNDA